MFDIATKCGGRTVLPYPTNFEMPERCLLFQALLWGSRGQTPIPDAAFIAAPDAWGFEDLEEDITAPLVRCLATGYLDIDGVLTLSVRGSYSDIDDVAAIRLSEYEPGISNLVSMQNVNFVHNSINLNEAAREFASLQDQDDVDRWIARADPERLGHQFVLTLKDVTVSTEELLDLFPKETAPGSENSVAPIVQQASRGAPPKFNWDQFWAELVVRAQLDGLPGTQAECLAMMAEWCDQQWGRKTCRTNLS